MVIPITSATPSDEPVWGRCARCQGSLTLHQPDVQSPARLLGFCERCRGWYLILVDPCSDEAMMVVLPESEWFRAAWVTHEGGA